MGNKASYCFVAIIKLYLIMVFVPIIILLAAVFLVLTIIGEIFKYLAKFSHYWLRQSRALILRIIGKIK